MYYRWMILLGRTEIWMESIFSQFSKETTIRFAHADLIPKNIIIEESTTTDIGDWALSGFFPDFLEYGRMRDPAVMVFPGPRRQAEINSLRRLLQILSTVFLNKFEVEVEVDGRQCIPAYQS